MSTTTSAPVQVTAEIMENFMAATAVDTQHKIEAVQDSRGFPIIFSIGSQNELYAIYRNESIQSGWSTLDLSSYLGDQYQVDTFISSQSTSGQIVLAMWLVQKNDTSTGTFYVTGVLTNDVSKAPWTDFTNAWETRPGMPTGGIIKKIVSGNHTSRTKPPLIMTAIQESSGYINNYFVNNDASDPNGVWEKYNLPDDTDDLLDIAPGKHSTKGEGAYALYNDPNNNLNLIFTSKKDQYGKTSKISLTPPAGAKYLQTLPDTRHQQHASLLFIAGQGIHFLDSTNQKTSTIPSSITADGDFNSLTQLVARQDNNKVVLWALNEENHQNNLYYINGDQAAHRNWTTPNMLRSNVSQIAAFRNSLRSTNELFCVESSDLLTNLSQDSGGSASNTLLSYLYQDPVSTMWNHNDIPLPAMVEIQKFPCFTSVINFVDDDGNPRVNETVNVNASGWVQCTINGQYCSIDDDLDNPFIATTDSTGNITIINKISTVSTPIFWLNADFLDEELQVNPAQKILDGFRGIQSGDDFPQETQNGDVLVSSSIQDADTNKDLAASNMSNLMDLADALPQDGSMYVPPSNSGANAFIVEPAASKRKVSNIQLPDDFGWAMLKDQGRWHKFEGADFQQQLLARLNEVRPNHTLTLAATDVLDGIWAAAGDVFQALENGIEAIGSWALQVAEDVVEFVVEIGGTFLKIALQSLAQVVELINWILKELLGIDLKKIIEWLGFLFSWDDIVTTHKVMTNMSKQTVNYLQSLVEKMKDPIESFFDDLIAKAASIDPLSTPYDDQTLSSVSQSAKSQSSPQTMDGYDAMVSSPGGTFASYQVAHGGVLSGTLSDDFLGDSEGAVEDFINDMMDILGELFDEVESAFTEIIDAYSAGEEVTIGDILKVFTSTLIEALLTALKGIFIAFLDAVEFLIQKTLDVLEAEIDIPLVSGLYSFVAGGSPLSVLDAMSLLLSIPTTIVYKIVAGRAPFEDGTYGLDTMTYDQIFQYSDNLELFSVPTLMLATTNEEPAVLKYYSQIGGFFGVVGNVVGFIIYLVKAAEKGEIKFINTIDTVVGALYYCCAIPIPEGDETIDYVEEGLDFLTWIGEGIGLLLKGYLAKVRRADSSVKAATETVENFYDLGLGLFKSGIYVLSYILEEVYGQNEDEEIRELLKFIQNLTGGLGTAGAGATGLSEDDPLAAAATAVLKGISAIIGGLRTVDAVIEEDIYHIR
ncbi:MAG: hypothetical protein AAF242_03345 [Bacteroidota bacterium]